MKTYATASNARRAARAAITDVDKPQEGDHYEIVGDEIVGWSWRRIQNETKAPAATKPKPIAPPTKRATKEDYAHLGLNKAPEYAEPPEDASQPEDEDNPKRQYRKGAVREVWDICEANQDLRRKDVINICISKGINYYTARTQYQAWRTAMKNSQ